VFRARRYDGTVVREERERITFLPTPATTIARLAPRAGLRVAHVSAPALGTWRYVTAVAS
jgi:hypothetical protein